MIVLVVVSVAVVIAIAVVVAVAVAATAARFVTPAGAERIQMRRFGKLHARSSRPGVACRKRPPCTVWFQLPKSSMLSPGTPTSRLTCQACCGQHQRFLQRSASAAFHDVTYMWRGTAETLEAEATPSPMLFCTLVFHQHSHERRTAVAARQLRCGLLSCMKFQQLCKFAVQPKQMPDKTNMCRRLADDS